MPTRPRPPKAAGTNTYQGEVARGTPDIIDAEIDADFDTVYGMVNGQLDDDNINASLSFKKIQYPKLDLAGRIQQTDLAPGFTLPPSSVVITTIDNLALGVSWKQFALGYRGDGFQMVHGQEVGLIQDTVTTRGYAGIIVGYLLGQVFSQAGQGGTLRVRIRWDGVEKVDQLGSYGFVTSGEATMNSFVVPWMYGSVPAGDHTAVFSYELDMNPGSNFNIFHAASALFVFEPA